MERLSTKQRTIRARETRILDTARDMLLSNGYYAMTMDRVAEASEYPKGTVYQRFACKEDIVVALAIQCLQQRLEMMRRGGAYPGRTRERVVAIGESMALYSRLHPDNSRIIHMATGPIREKASPDRIQALRRIESDTVSFFQHIMEQAVIDHELPARDPATIRQIMYALWMLEEGGYMMAESGMPQNALGIENPFQELWWIFNRLADAYEWRPLLAEQDWEEKLAHIRRTLFPEEAQQLYGPDAWYGDAGRFHPGKARKNIEKGSETLAESDRGRVDEIKVLR